MFIEILDFLFYGMSNLSLVLAVSMICYAHVFPSETRCAKFISRDMEMMMVMSVLGRVYWTCSPPRIWDATGPIVSGVVFLDLFGSIFMFSLLAYVGYSPKRARAKCRTPWYFKWPVLTAGTAVFSVVFGPVFFLFVKTDPNDKPWPLDREFVIFSSVSEAVGLIPQIYLLGNAEEDLTESNNSVITSFIALLGIARCFRMIFWGTIMVWSIAYGIYPETWPMMGLDLFYTVMMGDVAWIWIKKMQTAVADAIKQNLSYFREDASHACLTMFGYEAPIREERIPQVPLREVIKAASSTAQNAGGATQKENLLV